MRLVSMDDGMPRTGLVVGDEIVDLTDPAIGLPGDMVALLALGADAGAGTAAGTGRPGASAGRGRRPSHRPGRPPALVSGHRPQLRRPHRGARARAPRVPDVVLQAADLRDRAGRRPSRSHGCLRRSTTKGELGLVIGRRCRHVPADRALDVVAGYTVVNDVSVRDWQWRSPTMMMGKGFDTHGPTGPAIVTTDEVGDPQDLALRTWVNGELRQDGTTADMIFTCAQMIEHLSAAFTLEVGMLITTGTPAGVAAGEDPPRWLAAGDSVTVRIEGVGELTNPVVDEPAGTDGRGPVTGRCADERCRLDQGVTRPSPFPSPSCSSGSVPAVAPAASTPTR